MKQPVILIIEDNQLNLEMAKFLLQYADYSTLEAEDVENGIRLARESQPDLILMDMHMPIMDGYEASKILKSDPLTAKIPIVAFTASAMEDEQQKALNSGCSGLISKPIDVDQFAKQVAHFLATEEEEFNKAISA